MGYLDDEVKRLHGIISSIEGRVKALENGQLGGSQKKTADEVRMILIGPPGAGTLGEPAGITKDNEYRSITNRCAGTAQAKEHRPPGSRRSSTAATW